MLANTPNGRVVVGAVRAVACGGLLVHDSVLERAIILSNAHGSVHGELVRRAWLACVGGSVRSGTCWASQTVVVGSMTISIVALTFTSITGRQTCLLFQTAQGLIDHVAVNSFVLHV